jgi:Rieske Fe-S protein
LTRSTSFTRRALITTGGATVLGAGAVMLAACSPGGGATQEQAAGQDAGGPAIKAGTTVIALADIPVGGTASAKVDGQQVLLAQPTAGTVVCFSAICTHQGCTVAPAGKEFDCPCHGSQFAAATGDVLAGPAVKPLNKIAVTVSGDSVVTA